MPPVTVKVSADLEVADVMQDVTPEAALPTEVVTPEALLTEVAVDWPVQRLVMYMLVVVIVCQPAKRRKRCYSQAIRMRWWLVGLEKPNTRHNQYSS